MEFIPQEMRDRSQWLLWTYSTRPNADKPTKIPLDTNGEAIDATTADMSFNAVCEALHAHTNRFSGIGYSFHQDDPFVGYDLDGVLNAAGEITDEEIAEEVRRLNSYTEVSPSGQGLHVIFKGVRNPDMKEGKRRGIRELYFSRRYFTITGKLWTNNTTEIREIETDLLREIYQKVDPPKPIFIRPQQATRGTQTALVDREIIDRLRSKESTRSLYKGSISPFPSMSEATLSLLNHVVFYTQDRPQIDRIFRSSGLMRSKWNEARGSTTWGAVQIDKAIADVRNTYDPEYVNKTETSRGREIADRILSRRNRPCQN